MRSTTRKIIAEYHLPAGYTVAPDAWSGSDARVEIRGPDGLLCWRAFEFEPNFEQELRKNLDYEANHSYHARNARNA